MGLIKTIVHYFKTIIVMENTQINIDSRMKLRNLFIKVVWRQDSTCTHYWKFSEVRTPPQVTVSRIHAVWTQLGKIRLACFFPCLLCTKWCNILIHPLPAVVTRTVLGEFLDGSSTRWLHDNLYGLLTSAEQWWLTTFSSNSHWIKPL